MATPKDRAPLVDGASIAGAEPIALRFRPLNAETFCSLCKGITTVGAVAEAGERFTVFCMACIACCAVAAHASNAELYDRAEREAEEKSSRGNLH